ncbi:MAG: hypothetical protein ACRELE_12555 [Gemmatimonadales bacterium]
MTRALVVAALMVIAPRAAAPQAGGATHVLLITGLAAEPRFAKIFSAAAGAIDDAARGPWHVAAGNLVYLAEDPAADPVRITGKATRAAVAQAFAELARRVHPGDVVLVFLLGHGSGEMAASAVNLPGPDPTAADYAGWLAPLSAATVVFVNASSASGDFAPILAGPNRVIVTATRTAIERNESVFATFFAQGLVGTDADADQDGRVSVLEAFNYARHQVATAYESTNRLQTEHAMLVDSTGVASRVAFGGEAASSDPRVTALVGERRILESQVDSVRHLKNRMDSTTYQHSLEQLLLRIATKTQAIKALQSGSRP